MSKKEEFQKPSPELLNFHRKNVDNSKEPIASERQSSCESSGFFCLGKREIRYGRGDPQLPQDSSRFIRETRTGRFA
jgi:hypothetical protein